MAHVDIAIGEGRAVVENKRREILVFLQQSIIKIGFVHRYSILGSRLGRPAFMGKSVFGVMIVFL
jgi:hypothetical protein